MRERGENTMRTREAGSQTHREKTGMQQTDNGLMKQCSRVVVV